MQVHLRKCYGLHRPHISLPWFTFLVLWKVCPMVFKKECLRCSIILWLFLLFRVAHVCDILVERKSKAIDAECDPRLVLEHTTWNSYLELPKIFYTERDADQKLIPQIHGPGFSFQTHNRHTSQCRSACQFSFAILAFSIINSFCGSAPSGSRNDHDCSCHPRPQTTFANLC